MNSLRAIRRRQRVSQQELTLLAGVSIATLTLVERYDHTPSPPVRAKIAAALGVSEGVIWPELPEGKKAEVQHG